MKGFFYFFFIFRVRRKSCRSLAGKWLPEAEDGDWWCLAAIGGGSELFGPDTEAL
jgi:hypothetical protein